MEIKEIEVAKIKPYAKNAKRHSAEQVDRIAKSITEFGFRQPVVVDNNLEIIIGHGRFEAVKKLGLVTVPCVMVDDLSDEQIKALRLADNKLNESEWDMDMLNLELEEIESVDMSDFGFLDDVLKDADDEMPSKENPNIQRKDLSDDFKLAMRVVVECDSEEQQKEVYEEMTERGFICRIE